MSIGTVSEFSMREVQGAEAAFARLGRSSPFSGGFGGGGGVRPGSGTLSKARRSDGGGAAGREAREQEEPLFL